MEYSLSLLEELIEKKPKWYQLCFNIKESEKDPDRTLLVESYLIQSTYVDVKNNEIHGVKEPVQGMRGSGCAIVNTLRALEWEKEQCECSLALLMAGDGSRLFGISATTSFCKGLLKILGITLLEQTCRQAALLMHQAPGHGENMVFLSGTDNILLPSGPLLVQGKPFADAKQQMFFFSQKVTLMDEQGELCNPKGLEAMTELGIMLLDEEETPLLFLEKPSAASIVETLRLYHQQDVYFNAFSFAMTRDAARAIVRAYSVPVEEQPLFSIRGFDWSQHVLSALACRSEKEWITLRAKVNGTSDFEQDANLWLMLWSAAQKVIQRIGRPGVVHLGKEAIWYDTGMARDVVEFCQHAVGNESFLRLFGVPPSSSPSLIIHSQLAPGTTVEPGCVIVDSILRQPCTLKRGTMVLSSELEGLEGQGDVLVYGMKYDRVLSTEPMFAYFSAQYMDGSLIHGQFPLYVNPKQIESIPWGDHYNVGGNANKRYVDQTIQPVEGKECLPSLQQLLKAREVAMQWALM